MRKPRPADYDPGYKKRVQPEEIDMEGVVGIKKRSRPQPAAMPPQIEPEESVSRHHDSMTPRHHDTVIPQCYVPVEPIRKALKEVGKEAATHRFTAKEKQLLADLIYHYRQQGIKTSENEIARIAINALAADFQKYKDEGILTQILRELNA